jgi:hypothetical protein
VAIMILSAPRTGEATNIITPKKIKSNFFILIALTSFFY